MIKIISNIKWEKNAVEKIKIKEKSFFDGNFALIDSIKKINWKKETVKEAEKTLSEEQIYQEVKSIQETVDTSKWKIHQSQWHGFKIKYPEEWLNPINQTALRGSRWEYRYQFRKNTTAENNSHIGFDAVIYNLKKIKGLAETDEFPFIKNEDLKKEGKCETIEGHLIETGDYPAEEIYIPPTDDCYSSTLFFSFTRGEYVYNLIPITKAGIEMTGDPRVEIVDNFPEFFAAVSTLNTIDIVRPKPIIAPRISAPFPVAFKSVNGRLICSNKNDHPSKSKKIMANIWIWNVVLIRTNILIRIVIIRLINMENI